MTSVDSKVAIIGAGVFGLSTALHLKQRGYKDVSIFDYQPYDQTAYDPSKGCDAASADVNKIFRCTYGTEEEYQNLAFSGRPIWLEWNKQLAQTPADQLPPGLTPQDDLLVPCGILRMSSSETLSQYDLESMAALEKAGLRHTQHIIRDEADLRRLEEKEKVDKSNWPLKARQLYHAKNGRLNGFFDTSGGLTYADKACAWALHLAKKAGVKTFLGPQVGKLEDLIVEGTGETKKVRGVRTADGKEHKADVVIVAGGGWTPGILPEVEGRLQATGGSVATIKLPKNRKDLWDKYAPENFPVWAYGVTGHDSPEFGGFYGFPRTKKGEIKLGYRGRKWTNFQTHPKTGQRLSTPLTKYTDVPMENLPKRAIDNIKLLLGDLFPDLARLGIADVRLCWYTDSMDNNFLIDYVPGYQNSLFVASGGSGHGFKFLPVLGKHVVNQLERIPDEFTDLWKWRSVQPGQHANGIDEGEYSGRDLASLEVAKKSDWVWTNIRQEARL